MAKNLELIALAASVSMYRAALEPSLSKAADAALQAQAGKGMVDDENSTIFSSTIESVDAAVAAGITPDQYANTATVIFTEKGVEPNTVRAYIRRGRDGIIFHHATPDDRDGKPITWQRLKAAAAESVRAYDALVKDGRADDTDREIARVRGIIGKHVTALARGVRPIDMGKRNPPKTDSETALRMLREFAERAGLDLTETVEEETAIDPRTGKRVSVSQSSEARH